MSSFNQFFRASTAAPQQRAPSSGATLPLSASFCEVLVGKDKHAIQLPVLPPSSEAKHLRQFCSLLLQHEDDHTSSELTTVIQQEIPIDSIQESFFCAQAVRKQILGTRPFQLQHLEFLGLLDSAGDQIVIGADIADPAKHQHNISYIQLKCSVDPPDFVNSAQDVASSPIQFSLQLPSHSRSSNGTISLLHSPAKKPSSVNSAQPSALTSARQQLFATAGFSTPVCTPT